MERGRDRGGGVQRKKLNKVNEAVEGCSTSVHFSKNAHIGQHAQTATFQYGMRHDSGQRKSA